MPVEGFPSFFLWKCTLFYAHVLFDEEILGWLLRMSGTWVTLVPSEMLTRTSCFFGTSLTGRATIRPPLPGKFASKEILQNYSGVSDFGGFTIMSADCTANEITEHLNSDVLLLRRGLRSEEASRMRVETSST